MGQKFPPPTEEMDNERPSQSHSTRFGYDQSIRLLGCYAILKRPDHGEPIWELTEDRWIDNRLVKRGAEFTHSEVLKNERLEDL